jgi:acyl-CoA thioester hydrolase
MIHKVQYYETDMMGVTHHSNYIRWMEEARIELMDRMGFPYIKMEAEGVIVPVKSLKVDYLKPCTFGDEVEITVGIQNFNGVVITIGYEMRVKDETVCRGVSEHVFLDRNGKFVRIRKVMPEFCAAVERLLAVSVMD